MSRTSDDSIFTAGSVSGPSRHVTTAEQLQSSPTSRLLLLLLHGPDRRNCDIVVNATAAISRSQMIFDILISRRLSQGLGCVSGNKEIPPGTKLTIPVCLTVFDVCIMNKLTGKCG